MTDVPLQETVLPSSFNPQLAATAKLAPACLDYLFMFSVGCPFETVFRLSRTQGVYS